MSTTSSTSKSRALARQRVQQSLNVRQNIRHDKQGHLVITGLTPMIYDQCDCCVKSCPGCFQKCSKCGGNKCMQVVVDEVVDDLRCAASIGAR